MNELIGKKKKKRLEYLLRVDDPIFDDDWNWSFKHFIEQADMDYEEIVKHLKDIQEFEEKSRKVKLIVGYRQPQITYSNKQDYRAA